MQKNSRKIYKHLVQQKVRNIHDISFVRHIWFRQNKGTFPINVYFNFKFVVQHIVHFAVQLWGGIL